MGHSVEEVCQSEDRISTGRKRASLMVRTAGVEETEALGAAVGRALDGSLLIGLQGELGAGKTAWTRGLARVLQIERPITSPTFTLVNEYQGTIGEDLSVTLVHMDSYRLGETREEAVRQSATIDLEEWLEALDDPAEPSTVLLVIEWAERLAGLLPEDRLSICFVHDGEEEREIWLESGGEGSNQVMMRLKEAFDAAPPSFAWRILDA